MNINPLSADTHRLVSQLAQCHGASALNVVARCFPRFTPAEQPAGFRQLQYEFSYDRVPDALAVPADADEVTITVQGMLGDALAKREFKEAVENVFNAPPFSIGWDVRVYFDSRQQSSLGYQIKVFTTPPC